MAENQDLNIDEIDQEILGQNDFKFKPDVFEEAPEEEKEPSALEKVSEISAPVGVPKPLSPYILFMKTLKNDESFQKFIGE